MTAPIVPSLTLSFGQAKRAMLARNCQLTGFVKAPGGSRQTLATRVGCWLIRALRIERQRVISITG
jgi:hypothetical protein